MTKRTKNETTQCLETKHVTLNTVNFVAALSRKATIYGVARSNIKN